MTMNVNSNETIPIMLTITEAVGETGLPEFLIRRMCRQGKIVTIRTGKKWLINRDSLIRFMSEGGTIE